MIKLNKINLPLVKNVDTFPNYNISKKNKYIIHFGVGKFPLFGILSQLKI